MVVLEISETDTFLEPSKTYLSTINTWLIFLEFKSITMNYESTKLWYLCSIQAA